MRKRLQQIAGVVLLVNLAFLVYFKSGEEPGIIVARSEQGTHVGFYPDDSVNAQFYDPFISDGSRGNSDININNNNKNNKNNKIYRKSHIIKALVENNNNNFYDGAVFKTSNITTKAIISGKSFTHSGRQLSHGLNRHIDAGRRKSDDGSRGQFAVVAVAQPLQATGSYTGDNGGTHSGNSCSGSGLHAPVFTRSWSPHWQTVVLNNTYVYSAFHDNRRGGSTQVPVVKIIGMSQQETRRGLFSCQVWFHSNRGGPPSLKVVPADVDIVPETHERRFAVFFYLCELDTDQVPYAVSLVMDKCATPTNVMMIEGLPRQQQGVMSPMVNFTVCVTPLNFHYKNTFQLVEMVEVNRVLGANKIVFYNHTTSPTVDKFLMHYVKLGVVEVNDWKVPVNTDVWPPVLDREVEVHYFAQLAALNDCLYRHMHTSRFIVFTDLDEFIVPRKPVTWYKLLLSLPSNQDEQPYGCFLFQNVFFKTEWPSDPEFQKIQTVRDYHITSLLKSKKKKVPTATLR